MGASLVLLVGWVLLDLYGPWSADLRRFDATRMARLETGMWRAYYDKRPARLYWLLVETLRSQQQFPLWRASLSAFRAARAAGVFQEGHSRPDYERALPDLERYYDALCRLGQCAEDSRQLARLELAWWIVHREREEYGEAALTQAIAAATAALYGVDAEEVQEYARARARAMLLRDEAAETGGITDEEWDEIEATLRLAYRALAVALTP